MFVLGVLLAGVRDSLMPELPGQYFNCSFFDALFYAEYISTATIFIIEEPLDLLQLSFTKVQ